MKEQEILTCNLQGKSAESIDFSNNFMKHALADVQSEYDYILDHLISKYKHEKSAHHLMSAY